MRCGQVLKALFRKGFAAMGYAAHAIEANQRRSCRPKPSLRPSIWFASTRCCNGHRLDSRPGPNVLGLLLHVCDRSWLHDVQTKFPSRVFHTPVRTREVDKTLMMCYSLKEENTRVMESTLLKLRFGKTAETLITPDDVPGRGIRGFFCPLSSWRSRQSVPT